MSRNLEQRIKKLEQNRSHQVHLELPLFTVLSEDKKALLLDAGTLALLGVKQPATARAIYGLGGGLPGKLAG